MPESVQVEKKGNPLVGDTNKEVSGEENTVLLTADHMEKHTPSEIEKLFGVPVAKQKEGLHIVRVGEALAKEIETAFNEFVRPQVRDKLANLVTVSERCRKIQESNPANAMIAMTSRINCRHDIHHVAQEISRYIAEDHLLSDGQQTDATLARDLLMAATNALKDKRFAAVVARVKEAQQAFSKIGDSEPMGKETTLKVLVRPRMQDKLAHLVASAEQCEKIHETNHDDSLLAVTSRFNCHGDIYQMTQEISRYITVDNMFTSKQEPSATQARDSLRAATNALASMRMADAVTRIREAQTAFLQIWDGAGEA